MGRRACRRIFRVRHAPPGIINRMADLPARPISKPGERISRFPLSAAFLASAVMMASIAWGEAGSGPSPIRQRIKREPAKPSESSRFLPAEIRFRGKAQEAGLRALLTRLPTDSTRTWRMDGDCLRLSYDLLQDLSGGDMPVTGRGMGDRLSAILFRSLGQDLPLVLDPLYLHRP